MLAEVLSSNSDSEKRLVIFMICHLLRHHFYFLIKLLFQILSTNINHLQRKYFTLILLYIFKKCSLFTNQVVGLYFNYLHITPT